MVKLKLCPNCKEPRLKNAMNVSGWLAPDLYECTNCKYTGALYIQVTPEEFKRLKEAESAQKDEE